MHVWAMHMADLFACNFSTTLEEYYGPFVTTTPEEYYGPFVTTTPEEYYGPFVTTTLEKYYGRDCTFHTAINHVITVLERQILT